MQKKKEEAERPQTDAKHITKARNDTDTKQIQRETHEMILEKTENKMTKERCQTTSMR